MSLGQTATIVSLVLGFLSVGFYLVRVTRAITLKADSKIVSENLQKRSEQTSEKFRDVYERIDGIKDKYVRRDDLFNHLKHLEEGLARIERNQEETNKQIMKVIEHK